MARGTLKVIQEERFVRVFKFTMWNDREVHFSIVGGDLESCFENAWKAVPLVMDRPIKSLEFVCCLDRQLEVNE